MTCEELYRRLTDLSEGVLDETLCAEVNRHLEDCASCQAMRRDLEDLSRLCREPTVPAMPGEVRGRIAAMLEAPPDEPAPA
jgi:hypothetical protein